MTGLIVVLVLLAIAVAAGCVVAVLFPKKEKGS